MNGLVKAPRLAKLAGQWANLCSGTWVAYRCYGALLLLLFVRLDILWASTRLLAIANEPLSTALLVYVLTAITIDALTAWRDQDLEPLLAHSRQCTHHIKATDEPIMPAGYAFSVIACWVSLTFRFAQLVSVIIVLADLEVSGATHLVLIWRLLAAVCDMMNELGRAVAIRYNTETIFLNAQLGGGTARFHIASPHPEWGLLRGYRYFVLRPPVDTPPGAEFGINLLDDDNDGNIMY